MATVATTTRGALPLAAGASVTARRGQAQRRLRLAPARVAKKDEQDNLLDNLDDKLQKILPDRQPGEFPETGVHPAGWDQITIEETEEPFDPLRDGPLRYLGYANELGEAFSAWLPVGGVPVSYAIAIAYVLVDTFDKGTSAQRESEQQLERKSSVIPEIVNKRRLANVLAGERAIDTVVWQLLASVAIPGFTIHQVVAITHYLLSPHLQHLSDGEIQELSQAATSLHVAMPLLISTIDKMVPTLMGLVAIPFIVHPIDEGVHALLDKTLRPTMKNVICDELQGNEAGLDICTDPFGSI